MGENPEADWDDFDDEKRLGFGQPPPPDFSRERKRKHSSESPERPAAMDVAISKQNKGYQLLMKLGWKKEEGLGKRGQGIVFAGVM